jgi:hypothetical protein
MEELPAEVTIREAQKLLPIVVVLAVRAGAIVISDEVIDRCFHPWHIVHAHAGFAE